MKYNTKTLIAAAAILAAIPVISPLAFADDPTSTDPAIEDPVTNNDTDDSDQNSDPSTPDEGQDEGEGGQSDPSAPETPEADIVTPQVTLTLKPTDYTVGSWVHFLRTINKETGYNPAISTLNKQVTLDSNDFNTTTWPYVIAAKDELVPATMPYCINLSINGDPCTRMAFCWETNSSQKAGVVQIVQADNREDADFTSSDMIELQASCETRSMRYSNTMNNLGIEETYVDDQGKTQARTLFSGFNFHKALAQDLTPGTTYCYRVGTEGAWSPVGSFTTSLSDLPSFSFIYATDSQAQTDEMFAVTGCTIRKAAEMFPNPQFMLFNGDFCETISNNAEWEWEQWHKCAQDIWLNTRLVTTMGNHDMSVRVGTTDQYRNFESHFNNDTEFFDNNWPDPINSHKGSVYSFEIGNVLFLVMSFEEIDFDGYAEQVAEWMRRQVNMSSASWKIACFHQTMFTGSASHQDDERSIKMRKILLPVFGELGIHLALQGHDHVYEVIGPVNPETMTPITDAVEDVKTVAENSSRVNVSKLEGGRFNVHDGTLYFLNGSCGQKKYSPRYLSVMRYYEKNNGVANYSSLFTGKYGQSDLPSFSNVKVTPDVIYIDTYNVNPDSSADLYDSFTVVKDKKDMSGITNEISDVFTGISISYDSHRNSVDVAGITPDRIFVYTADGTLSAYAEASSVGVSHLGGGYYIVRVDKGDHVYTSKILIQ